MVGTYVALIILFAWPLPLHLADELSLLRGSDVWPHIWNFAWMRTALLDLHQSPYHTYAIYYPTGVPLVYHAFNPFSAAVSVPLQLAFGLIPAFNLVMLGNLLAGALAAYWLARVLGLGPRPAFVAGLLFACSPSLGAALDNGQGELVSVFWMPLYIGLLVRACGLRARGLPAGRRAYLLAAGLALAGSALAIWYWLVSLLVFTAVYALVEGGFALREGGTAALRPLVARLAAVAGVAALALLPLLALLAVEQLRSGTGLGISASGSNDAVVFNSSQDLLAYLLPLPVHNILGGSGLHGSELGFGWTVIALAVVAFLLGKGRRRGLLLWAAGAFALALLALGPELILNGQPTGVPLPYAALLDLPGAAAMRVPVRFDTLLGLFMGLLAAHGVAEILARLARPAARAGVVALVLALAAVEFFGLPRTLITPQDGPFFAQLAAHPSPCLGRLPPTLSDCDAVLELPQADWIPPGMYHQAIDAHPMIGGYLSRHYPYDFPNETPGVAQLVASDPAPLGSDIITPSVRQIAVQAMDYYGVRYVLVHPTAVYPRAAQLQQTLAILFPGGGQAGDDMTVYTVPHVAQNRAFLFLGENWYDQEHNAAGLRWRWADQAATVRIVVPPPASGAYDLGIQLFSITGTRTLVAGLDGHEIARRPVTPAPGNDISLPFALSPGEHLLTLASVEPAVEPPNDKRTLSLGYRGLTLTPRH